MSINLKEIAIDLVNIPLIEKWCAERKQAALDMALKGEKIPGWKLVIGRKPPKKWAIGANDYLESVPTLTEEMIYTKKMITPAQLLKLKESKEIKDELNKYMVAGEGAPTLAVESDKRDEYTPNVATKDEFDLMQKGRHVKLTKKQKEKLIGKKIVVDRIFEKKDEVDWIVTKWSNR